jgi:hypothetical protein
MKYTVDGNAIQSWLSRFAIVLGAIGLGWALAKAGFNDALYAVSGPLVIAVLAAAALWVFLLPFQKHLPRIPVSDRALGALGQATALLDRAAGFIGLALSSSVLFASDSVGFIEIASGIVGLVAAWFVIWRLDRVARREAAKQG